MRVFNLSSQIALTGYCFLDTVINQYIVFLVPDWSRVRTSKWTPSKTFLLFSDNLAVALGFLTLQDKHNICTLSYK